MGIVKKKVSQTEQQTYKGESRKAYLRYFSPSVVSQGLFLEKDQTKCFPPSIVSTETWRFISSLVLGAIKAPERKDSILRDALKGRVCQQYQSSCLVGQYRLIVRQPMYLSISRSSSSSSSFSSAFQETTPPGVSQINNSLVALVIPPGQSPYKPSTLCW